MQQRHSLLKQGVYYVKKNDTHFLSRDRFMDFL